MRIFPEGAREWNPQAAPSSSWPGACSRLQRAPSFLKRGSYMRGLAPTGSSPAVVSKRQSDDGATLCSAVESVHYVVDGRDLSIENGGHSFTSDCDSVRAAVAAAPGQSRIVTFNKRAPGAIYVNPGFNIEFYLVAFILTCMAGGFAFAGWGAIKVGCWMARRGIELP
jgi:hypothetical protein